MSALSARVDTWVNCQKLQDRGRRERTIQFELAFWFPLVNEEFRTEQPCQIPQL